MAQQDYYHTLGVEPGATAREIKDAYRKLAFKYHPDRTADRPDSAEMMKAVNEAYAVLSDPPKRRAYDGMRQRFGQPVGVLAAFADAIDERTGEYVLVCRQFFASRSRISVSSTTSSDGFGELACRVVARRPPRPAQKIARHGHRVHARPRAVPRPPLQPAGALRRRHHL